MAPTALELKALNLERHVNTLLEQYTAVNNELIYETNPATRVLKEKQAEDLLQQYEDKQTQLEQLREKLKSVQQGQNGENNPPKNQNRVQLQWKQYLPKIDF